MNTIGKTLFDIGYMDALSSQDTPLKRLDARVKIICTLIFIITVVSFDKYVLFKLMPFFVYPVVLITLGRIPVGYILKKLLIVSPFAVLVGICNPFLDHGVLFYIGGIGISGGWISFLSILVRFFLTVSAALILISITGFNAISESLVKLGVPRPFVTQLLFFYRYIFVLTDEAERAVRAWSFRALGSGKIGIKTFVSLLGHLLLRTLERAERIYSAMRCRGFDGYMHTMGVSKLGFKEVLFTLFWSSLFIFFRLYDIPLMIGTFIMEAIK